MKKRTKPATSPAPATSSSIPPRAAFKAAAPDPKAVGSAPPAKIAPPPAAGPQQAGTPAPSRVPAAPPPTVISANIDVGFGNTLHIRGEGPGLSWGRGIPLDCVAADKWLISIHGAKRPIVFKFLLNDKTWSTGRDFVADPGSRTGFTPSF